MQDLFCIGRSKDSFCWEDRRWYKANYSLHNSSSFPTSSNTNTLAAAAAKSVFKHSISYYIYCSLQLHLSSLLPWVGIFCIDLFDLLAQVWQQSNFMPSLYHLHLTKSQILTSVKPAVTSCFMSFSLMLFFPLFPYFYAITSWGT